MRLAYNEKQNDSMDNITLFLMVLNFECTVYVLYQNHQLLSFSVFVVIRRLLHCETWKNSFISRILQLIINLLIEYSEKLSI